MAEDDAGLLDAETEGAKRIGRVASNPDDAHEVRLRFVGGGMSSWLKVTKLAQASSEDAQAYQQEEEALQKARAKFVQGVYAIHPKTAAVGRVVANPDKDNDVKLRFADGSTSSWVRVTKLAEASAEDARKYKREAS